MTELAGNSALNKSKTNLRVLSRPSLPDSMLSTHDRYVYRELFLLADDKAKLFLSRSEAMNFFSQAGIPIALLDEIWKTVDKEQKEYIAELEFYQALKLIACIQHGIEASEDILSTQAPLPQFTGITIKPKTANVTAITPGERDAYIGVFQSCNPVDGILYAEQAIELFNKSGLSVERLRDIWELADTRKSGTLNKTEFIIAMYYINQSRNNPHLALPSTLPPQVYSEASGRFNTSTQQNKAFTSPTISINKSQADSSASLVYSSPAISQAVASPIYSPSLKGGSELPYVPINQEEKEKYTLYFKQLDVDGSGYIDSEEAVYFFSHSQLPDSELGVIWEIADSRHLGKLDLHDFSVAMYLINMRLRGENIEKYVNALTTQQQGRSLGAATQPGMLNSQEDLNYRFELENQLLEIKQQLNAEQQRFETFKKQLQEEFSIINALEAEISSLKSDLTEAKMNAEKKEELLQLEQKRNRELLNSSSYSLQSSFSSSEILGSSTPELTRTLSVFSGTSSTLSPRSDADLNVVGVNPFPGFKKSEINKTQNTTKSNDSQIKAPLSPQQSKAILKYGFDITVFDTLSIKDDAISSQNHDVKDELASIFGVSSLDKAETTTQTSLRSEFDNIFLH